MTFQSKRLNLPQNTGVLDLYGGKPDHNFKNRSNSPALARRLATWLTSADFRFLPGRVPQGVLGVRGENGPEMAIASQGALTTPGLVVTLGQPLSLLHCAQTSEVAGMLNLWFGQMWQNLRPGPVTKHALLDERNAVAKSNISGRLYHAVLYHLFKDLGGELDEKRIVRSGTGIKRSVGWCMPSRFQRDGIT